MKKVSKKIVALIMTMVIAVGMFSVTAFADGVEEIPYATTYNLSGFVFQNTNTSPTKIASTDLRTHRMIVKVCFSIYEGDSNQTPMRLTVKVKRSNGTYETIGYADAYSRFHYYELQTSWFTVYPGENLQIFFDASTSPNGGTSTGTYRYAQIYWWQIYND